LFLDVISKEAKVLLLSPIHGRSTTFLRTPLFKTSQKDHKYLTVAFIKHQLPLLAIARHDCHAGLSGRE